MSKDIENPTLKGLKEQLVVMNNNLKECNKTLKEQPQYKEKLDVMIELLEERIGETEFCIYHLEQKENE